MFWVKWLNATSLIWEIMRKSLGKMLLASAWIKQGICIRSIVHRRGRCMLISKIATFKVTHNFLHGFSFASTTKLFKASNLTGSTTFLASLFPIIWDRAWSNQTKICSYKYNYAFSRNSKPTNFLNFININFFKQIQVLR